MTKDKLWTAYCARNPSFNQKEGTTTFTNAGLKKFFDQTYDKGFEHGKGIGGSFADILKGIKL